MSEQTAFGRNNVIAFPVRRRTLVRPADGSFLADYERLVRAFAKIGNPKTRALIIELLKASSASVRFRSSR
jgi:hypothetical protein